MMEWNDLREMTLTLRRGIADQVREEAARADVIPPSWRNNLRWHVGHLAIVPRSLTHGLAGEPTGVSPEWLGWFKKGSAPESWGSEPVPPLDHLLEEMVRVPAALFDVFEGRSDLKYAAPYQTSVGVVLTTPAEALAFSMVHDGIHFGWIVALKRALRAM